jgi:penicillin amidase
VNAVVSRSSWRTSLDHRLLRLPLSPWTAEDACLLAKGMALGLSFKWRCGPVFAAIAEALRERTDALAAILPRPPGRNDPAIARYAAATRGLAGALSAVGWEAPLAGSNSFVVGGARSASGAPILANDPHLALSLPSVWYLASVSGGPYAAVGATMAGVPGVVIGRTPTVAWGLTNVQLDDADLFQEEVDGTGTRYRVDGVWRDLSVETQEIARRGRGPVMFRLRRTHRGPLLTDALGGAEGRPLSLRLMLHETVRDMPTFLRLGRARTGEDVERAAEGYGTPAQNLIWATSSGEAGYLFLGRVPVRGPGPHPALPRDGTVSSSDWTGEVPVAQLPRYRIRPEGQIVTANQPTVGPEFPHYLSHLYEPGYRAARIRELLGARTGLRAEDLAAIQLDAKSLGAEAFRQAVILPCADAIRASRPPAVPLLDRLLAASGEEGVDAVGPALLHFTYFRLAEKVFAPALGEDLVHRWMACVNDGRAPAQAFSDPRAGSPRARRCSARRWRRRPRTSRHAASGSTRAGATSTR